MNPLKKSKSTTNNFEVAFENKTGRRVAHGFNGEVQFNGVQYGSAEHNKLALQYNKERSNNINDKNWKVAKGVGKVLDPTGISSWGDVSRAFSKEGGYFDKTTSLVSAIPILGNVEKGGIRLVKGITDAEKALNTVQKIEKIVDKGNDLVSIKKLDGYVAKKTGKVLDKVFPIKRTTTMAEANKRAKINLSTSIINTTNKITDISDLAPSFKNMYDGYAQSKATIDNKKKETNTKNLAIENTTKKYAMGGSLRPSSRNRHIAPMIIAAGVQAGIGLVGSFLGMGAADKARREQIKQIAEQERNAQALQRAEQKRNDTVLYNKTNLEGDSTVQYYAEGGKLNPLTSTQQPMVGRAINNTSLAGYATKGGNLVQIGDGVEEARGNKHNETKIDGVSGIQLHPEGAPEPIAEIEDKEILVDGNKVLSQQLKYKGNQSYADKMRQIVKNRNKLEKEQLETKSTRKKNTVERKLAGLNMAEETLFKVQEAHKELEGTQVLDKLKSFANGGTIGEPIITEGKYKGWTKTAKGFYRHPADKNIIVDENGMPKYNYELEKEANMFGVKSVTPNQTPIPVNTPTLPAPSTNSVPAPIIVPPPSAAAMPGQIAPPASTNQPSKLEGFLSSSTGQGIIGALPGIASGIGAYIMAGNTPPLPKPLLNRAETLETRVNVNPQLANIRGTVKASVDNILQNTSSSNNAKQNIASVRLKGAAEVNNVLNNKENTETQLKNADSQNRQMVANANTATLNQDGMNQYQRLNDIRTMKSAGFAHITGAIQNGINIKRTADNFDAYTKANLADDKLGEKVGLYMNDRNFMANPSNRETVISILNTKTSDGQYKYPFDRANAIKKGLITE